MLAILAITGHRDGKHVDLLRFYEDGTVEIGDVPNASKEAMHILATHWREEMSSIAKGREGDIVAALLKLDQEAFVRVMEKVRDARCTNCGAPHSETSCWCAWCARDSRPDC